MDNPWFRYLTNLHEYWIERLPSFTDFRASEIPIHFPCRSISHYLIYFRQPPRCRNSAPAMPTQKWPWRAPPAAQPAGTAAAKKRSTRAARDVVAAGTSCGDGRGEEDVHNGDAGERWPPAPAGGSGGAGSWPRPAPAARTGALPLGMWPWPAPAAPRRGQARFRPGSFVCLLQMANWNKGHETKLFMPHK